MWARSQSSCSALSEALPGPTNGQFASGVQHVTRMLNEHNQNAEIEFTGVTVVAIRYRRRRRDGPRNLLLPGVDLSHGEYRILPSQAFTRSGPVKVGACPRTAR